MIDPKAIEKFTKHRAGCLIRGGDYLESELISINNDSITFKSTLFGIKRYPREQILFVKLNDFNPQKASFELLTKSRSKLRADWLMFSGADVLVKDNSFCWIKLVPEDIATVHGISSEGDQ